MQQSTILIIQCITILLVIFGLYYYFNKKISYQLSAIESLQNQILEQQKYIDNHEKLLRQIFGPAVDIPRNQFTHQRTVQTPQSFNQEPQRLQQSQQQQPQQPPQQNLMNPLLNIAPMVTGLMGVLNTISTPNPQDILNNEDEINKFNLDESEIKKELSKELDELKDPSDNIKEGRIDIEKEKNITIETNKEEIVAQNI